VTSTEFFFAFEPAYRRLARLFGITPSSARVMLNDGELLARFGPWRVTTPCSNIVCAAMTGPYRFWKAAGPARLSLVDLGLTFATNGRQGLCMKFRDPVHGLEPTGRLRHPGLTVTLADCEGLARALQDEAGRPMVDPPASD
jgi:hypothetical protein